MIINQINFRALLLALMFILFILNSSILNAQSGSSVVKGLVPNKNSDPEVGVLVIVRNTKNNFIAGTSTDSWGTFTFSRVSFILTLKYKHHM